MSGIDTVGTALSTVAQARLEAWVTASVPGESNMREVTIMCAPDMYSGGLPMWKGEARRRGAFDITVEAGPAMDLESLAQLLIDRLALAGVLVP